MGAALAKRTGNPGLAAEAAQAVFVKLAQKPREAAAHSRMTSRVP